MTPRRKWLVVFSWVFKIKPPGGTAGSPRFLLPRATHFGVTQFLTQRLLGRLVARSYGTSLRGGCWTAATSTSAWATPGTSPRS